MGGGQITSYSIQSSTYEKDGEWCFDYLAFPPYEPIYHDTQCSSTLEESLYQECFKKYFYYRYKTKCDAIKPKGFRLMDLEMGPPEE